MKTRSIPRHSNLYCDAPWVKGKDDISAIVAIVRRLANRVKPMGQPTPWSLVLRLEGADWLTDGSEA